MNAELQGLLKELQIDKKEKRKMNKIKFKEINRSKLISSKKKTNLKTRFKGKDILKNVLKYLKRGCDSSAECKVHSSLKNIVDDQVKLKCRQLPNVLCELRKSIMRQDWNETATLLMIMCHPGLKLYNSIIIRTCFLLLFNHPNSNFYLLQDFVRSMTGYVLEEDINKFIKILFALRRAPLNQLEIGKYIRKTGDYKVTRDPEFENL